MIERSFFTPYFGNSRSEVSENAKLEKPIDERNQLGSRHADAVCENIREALHGLQFGEITITVRSGSVVQIERVARNRKF